MIQVLQHHQYHSFSVSHPTSSYGNKENLDRQDTHSENKLFTHQNPE